MVCRDGREVVIGAAKQRALLAVLLLHANEVVSTDRLIDALWGEKPPARAGKTVQVYVSQLRKALSASSVLTTRPPGYAIEPPPGSLDVQRFAELCADGREALADGRADLAAEHLRDALSLWRGPALADLSFESFAQPHTAQLEEQRLAAVEDRIEAELALGRHAGLVGELEALVDEHPLRERLRSQLLLSLYRSGRQADALAAFQEARRALVDEFGIEPGRQLRQLQQAMLQQDESLDLDPPAAAPRAPQPTVIETAPHEEQVSREARKTITAVSVNLTASSAHGSPLDPEAARRVSRRALAHVQSAVEHHGGTLETVAGEAVTAIFGLPALHEDDALRAVRAAAELHELLGGLETELDEHGARLDHRTGVSTGEVVTGGEVGPQQRATGEPLVVSARLAQAADAGAILLDEATHRLTRNAVVIEQVERGAIPGLRLVGLAEGEGRYVGVLASPMVGRSRERRRLQDAFEQAVVDRSCQLFTILGHAGVGKSRLVQEFVGDLADRASVARGRCLPYGEGITYWPLLEAIKEAASLGEADTPETSRDKLAALLDDDEADAVAQRVAGLIGLAEADAVAEEGFAAVRMLFEALARRRPLVLVFDDIHWGEATFLDLVEHIADWTREVPLVLVCVARPELLDIRPAWGGGKLNATAVLLEPLSAAESSELVENLAGKGLAPDARRRVIEAAEGNPLFVEEMLALALEDATTNGRFTVPPTIQALLAARLDRLADDERSVIECASVEGKVFHEGCVAQLSPTTLRPAVAASVAALMRKELIRPDRPLFAGERAFRFRHLLIRDAAYDSIPKEARADLHQRYAEWLESKAAARIAEYEEIVGYHLEQAFRYRSELGPVDAAAEALARRAAERLGAAGRRAFGRRDAPAAVNLISRAAGLLPVNDPARVDLVPNVRVAQGLSGDLSWADTVLGEALETGDERLKAHALVQRGFLRLFTEPEISPDELIGIAEQALAAFGELEDELGLARAWRLIAQARYLARSGAACTEASEQALVHARRAGDPFEVTEIVEWLAVALALGPAPAADASRRCEELLQDVAGDRFLEVTLLAVRAYLEALRGQFALAEELLASARRAAGDERSLRRVAYYSIYAALMLGDDPAAAELELRAGVEALQDVGEQTNYCTLAAQLARALCDQGRYAEAEEFTRASEDAARANDVMANVLWRAARARVMASQGDLEAAEALARDAIAFATASDFLNTHADALMDQADVLRSAGRSTEARAAVEQAIALYEQKGNLVSSSAARAAIGN